MMSKSREALVGAALRLLEWSGVWLRMSARTLCFAMLVALVALDTEATASDTSHLRYGVNVTHWMSEPMSREFAARHGIDGETFTAEGRTAWFNDVSLESLARLGFDHIRVMVDWTRLLDGEHGYRSKNEGFAELDQLVSWTERFNMGLVLAMYTLPGHYFATPQTNDIWQDREKRIASRRLWGMIARRYRARRGLYFDLLNEPVPPRHELWTELAGELLAEIRKHDEERVVILESVNYGDPRTLRYLSELEDSFLVFSFHFYEPTIFTFQQNPTLWGSWSRPPL